MEGYVALNMIYQNLYPALIFVTTKLNVTHPSAQQLYIVLSNGCRSLSILCLITAD